MLLLGYDIGSSAIKAAVLDAETGTIQASARAPSDEEMTMEAPRPGWAEQPSERWWEHVQDATAALRDEVEFDPEAIRGLGLSYQMHGLVLVGEDHEVLRPAIIWADSRAVDIGRDAFEGLDVVDTITPRPKQADAYAAAYNRWCRILTHQLNAPSDHD